MERHREFEDGAAGDAPQQQGVYLRGGDEARRIRAEKYRKGFGGESVKLDEDEGRAGDVGEHGGGDERIGERESHERQVAAEREIGPADLSEAASVLALFARQRFAEAEENGGNAEKAEAREHPEDHRPVVMRNEEAADHGREDGGEAHHQHEKRIDLRGGALVEKVAHHGAGRDDARATAKRLQETRDGEAFDVGGEGGPERGRGIDRNAEEKRAEAAHAVHDGAENALPHRKANEEDRERRLHRAGRHLKVIRDRREGRQIHVDRERREGDQRAENEDEADAGAERVRCIHFMSFSPSLFLRAGPPISERAAR